MNPTQSTRPALFKISADTSNPPANLLPSGCQRPRNPGRADAVSEVSGPSGRDRGRICREVAIKAAELLVLHKPKGAIDMVNAAWQGAEACLCSHLSHRFDGSGPRAKDEPGKCPKAAGCKSAGLPKWAAIKLWECRLDSPQKWWGKKPSYGLMGVRAGQPVVLSGCRCTVAIYCNNCTM